MDSHLQLIGSIVIAGIFMIGLMNFYGGVLDFTNQGLFDVLTQETTASLMEIVEHDFNRMGAGLASPALAIVSYDTSDITFLGDIDADGSVDSVRYFVSGPDQATATPNPNDVILFRRVNGVNTIDWPTGVVAFRVELHDETGNPTANPLEARMVDIALVVESTFPYNERYARAFWEKRITPVNLFRYTYTDF